jgi:hypothetical protein
MVQIPLGSIVSAEALQLALAVADQELARHARLSCDAAPFGDRVY